MQVFFSYHSDIILALLSILMLVGGITCVAVARTNRAAGPAPAWRFAGAALIVLAVREWLGIYAISQPVSSGWVALTSLMLVTTALLLLAAAESASGERRRPDTTIAAARILGLLAAVAIIVEPLFFHSQRLAGGKPGLPIALLLAPKATTLLAALVLAARLFRRADSPPAGVRTAAVLLAVLAALMAASLPPGIPVAPNSVDWTVNDVFLVLHLSRAATGLALAAVLWNLYAEGLGVAGRIRWSPLLIILFVALAGLSLVFGAALRQRSLVRRGLAAAARNAALCLDADALLEAAAERGSANNPDVARRIFHRARALNLFPAVPKVDIQVDALAHIEDGNLVVPIIDVPHHPEGGLWARGDESVRDLWSEIRNAGTIHRKRGLSPILVAAALPGRGEPARGSGGGSGAAVLSVSAVDLAAHMFAFKRPFLMLLPPAFLLLLLIISGQQRAWMDSHSLLRREAMRLGALAGSLTGVFITRGRIITDLNPRAAEILGIPRDELLGGDSGGISGEFVPSRAGGGDAPPFETAVRRDAGDETHLLARGRPLSPDGGDGHYLWEIVDITAQKTLERELRAARDRLQLIVDSLPVAVFVKDRAGRYLVANEKFASMFDFASPADAIGRTGDDIESADARFTRDQDEICVDMNGETLVYEQRFTRAEGERFYEISKTLKWIGANRRDYLIVGSAHDFTSRQKSQDAIRAERHFLHQLIDTLPVSVCFLDRDGVIRLCDKDFAREAGYEDAEELIGLPYRSVLPYGPESAADDTRLLERGGSEDIEFEIPGGDRSRNFVMRRSAMFSSGGETLGLVKTFLDSTPLVAANRAAKKADRAKAAFLAGMSHELRTPMNGIVGMTDLIIDRADSPATRLYGEVIIRSARTLQMAVDEIMDAASEEETGGVRLHSAPFSLLEVAADAVRSASCIVETRGVELFLDHDLDGHDFHLGDARRTRLLLIQFLVQCSRHAVDERLVLRASGGAAGDPEGARFEAFFRPTAGTTPARVLEEFRAGGDAPDPGDLEYATGPALAGRLIRLMGGSITADARKEGVRCRITIPARRTRPPPDGGPRSPDLADRRAVIALSDPRRTDTARKYLARTGARIETADTGDEILRLFAAGSGPARGLLVLDSGVVPAAELAAFLDELRGKTPAPPPAIVLVVSPSEVQSLGGAADRVHSLLLPPVCPGELWDKAAAALGRGPDAGGPDAGGREKDGKPPFHGARVLLVEDNTVNQMVSLGILKRLGCRPFLAGNGKEAVEAVARGEVFDVIFMDCMMPVMDGYEATSRIRMLERSSPGSRRNVVVALTANTVQGDRERCLAAGMDDYVTKPITLEIVRAALLRHLGGGEGERGGEAAE